MDFLLIGAVAFAASALTFFSGFGLGTLLLPAFAIFMPAHAAVAATGIVHLLNGFFKGALTFRSAHWPSVLRFGLPAIPGAIGGALALGALGEAEAVRWSALGRDFAPSASGLLIGVVLIVFAILELTPAFQKLKAPRRWMPLGGLVTGFMGGLTGQQGALRSMFLIKSGLNASAFIATGVMVAIMIDLARIPTYFGGFASAMLDGRAFGLIAVGIASAFAGALLGARNLQKATIGAVRAVVAGLLLVVGGGLVFGLIGA